MPEIWEKEAHYMSVWYAICLCGMPTNSSSNLKYEQCQRAQSSVAKDDDVRHSATKEMAIGRREN